MRFVEWVRALVRPLVTALLVGAFAYFAKVDPDAALIVAPPAMLVLGFWFKERGDHRGDQPTAFEQTPEQLARSLEQEKLYSAQTEASTRETIARAAKLEAELEGATFPREEVA